METDAAAALKFEPMLFTVIIPTCRRQDDLIACLDRLAPGRQTGFAILGPMDPLPSGETDRYEIVVSDDGDAEATRQRIGERASWARVVQGPRRGPAANRNNAVGHARGAWLAFTDDDCLPSARWLSAYRAALSPESAVLEGKTVTDEPYLGIFSQAPTNLDGGKLWSCNMLFRKSAFDELGGFDDKFPYPHMEDVDLRERVVARFGGFAFVDGAEVLHPQRRQKLGLKLARHKESNFYYAKKWGVRPAEAGFNFATLARVPLRQLLTTRLRLESFEYAIRLVGFWLAVGWLSIGWRRKYRI